MVIKIKETKDREYYPYKIKKYNSYRDKLKKVLNNNPNLNFMGMIELPTKKVGLKVWGKDSFNISDVKLFYTLGEIKHYYNNMIKENA